MWLRSHQGGLCLGFILVGGQGIGTDKVPLQRHVWNGGAGVCPESDTVFTLPLRPRSLFSQLWRSGFTNPHSSSHSLAGSNSFLLSHHFYRYLLNKCIQKQHSNMIYFLSWSTDESGVTSVLTILTPFTTILLGWKSSCKQKSLEVISYRYIKQALTEHLQCTENCARCYVGISLTVTWLFSLHSRKT